MSECEAVSMRAASASSGVGAITDDIRTDSRKTCPSVPVVRSVVVPATGS